MAFDPRIAIGWLFSVYGVLLVAYSIGRDGLRSGADLIWGGVLLVLGVSVLALRKTRRGREH